MLILIMCGAVATASADVGAKNAEGSFESLSEQVKKLILPALGFSFLCVGLAYILKPFLPNLLGPDAFRNIIIGCVVIALAPFFTSILADMMGV